MDGLAAGIAAIASTFLAISFATSGQPTEALMLAVFAGRTDRFSNLQTRTLPRYLWEIAVRCLLGFSSPVPRVDERLRRRSRSFIPVLAVPILVLFIPIFDTTFVTVLRKLSGRSASQGGGIIPHIAWWRWECLNGVPSGCYMDWRFLSGLLALNR